MAGKFSGFFKNMKKGKYNISDKQKKKNREAIRRQRNK